LQFFPQQQQQQQEMNFIQPLQQQSKLLAPLNTQPLNASDGLLNFPGLSSPTGCRSSTNRDPLLLMPESPRDSDKPKLNLPQLSTNFGRLPLKSPGPMSANGGDQLVGQLFGNFSSLTWQ
jgi:hypothetical protein